MIPPTLRDEIMRRLRAVEAAHEVRVLLAVESGSRGWGFASPDSDFDVRFIYIHPRDWYLSAELEEKRDVIEYAIEEEIDMTGWDARKALRLYGKSNPFLAEWLQSPILYWEVGHFAERLRRLLQVAYNRPTGIYHYLRMAGRGFQSYAGGEPVSLKQTMYVLRPLLAIRWIERYDSAPPMAFAELTHLIADDRALAADVEALMARKRSAKEKYVEPQVESIRNFMAGELQRLADFAVPTPRRDELLPLLDEIFRATLGEVDA